MYSMMWLLIIMCRRFTTKYCERVDGRVGVREEGAALLLSTASRAVPNEMLRGLALVALKPLAVGPERVLGPPEAHATGPALALALPLALAEPNEDVVQLVVGGVGEEGPVPVLALAGALGALAEAFDDASDSPRRLVAVEASPARLGVLVGPEELGSLLALGQVLDVTVVVLVVTHAADGVGVRARVVVRCHWVGGRLGRDSASTATSSADTVSGRTRMTKGCRTVSTPTVVSTICARDGVGSSRTH